jgi:hypothetical protein
MTNEQQKKIDWFSRAEKAEQTISALQSLQKQDTLMIQAIEPFKEDCSELYQRLQETQSKIKEELIQLAGVREEIRQVILAIPDEEIRNIFLRKYLAYETNEQIADAMFYNLRTVQRKHKKWLDRLVLPNVQEEEKTPF